MTQEQRKAVQRLVQMSLRRRAFQSAETAVADESLVREIREQIGVADDAELRHLIETAGNPIRLELQNSVRRQAAENFWLSWGNTKIIVIPLLAMLLAVGAFLRWDRIATPSLWFDEYWAVYLATGRSNAIFDLPVGKLMNPAPACGFACAPAWWHIWTGLSSVGHPPLYYLALRGWIDLFGDGDRATRGMSLVFSLLAIVVMFDVVRRSSLSAAQGFAAAAMMALAPAQIDFSQTARPYTMLVFFGLLVCDLLFVVESKGPSKIRMLWLTLALFALAMTHYFCAGAYIAIGLYSIIHQRGRTRRAVMIALVSVVACVIVLWGPMFWRARAVLGMDGHVRGPGIGIFQSFFNLPRRLLLHISLETGFLMMLAFAAVIYISPLLRLRRHPTLLLWWLWAVCVPGFLLVWDIVRGTHFVALTRYVLLASPAIYAIFATPFPTRLGRFVPAAFVFAAAISAFARWPDGPPGTPDIRTASHWIQSDTQPGDPIILYNDPTLDYFAIAHYIGQWQQPVVLLEAVPDENLERTLAGYHHVWIWGRMTETPDILPGWIVTPVRRAGNFSLYWAVAPR